VVPVVFSPAGDLVFERYTRCTRGAVGTPHELHGAQLLRAGDEVSIWTTPVAGEPTKHALVAAVCWKGEWTSLDCGGTNQAAFNMVSTGSAASPTPLEVVDAVFAHAVVHREPSTVVTYMNSPTKTGDKNVPGQGIGKTEWLRRNLGCAGPNLVDIVNDYEKLVKTDNFSDKGHSALFTLTDDVEDPKIVLSGVTKAAVTAKENESRVKHAANKKSDNFNTNFFTGNCHISLDEVEKSMVEGERRVLPARAWSTMAGDVAYFEYTFAAYFAVNPLIQKCIIEAWRNYPGVHTRTTGDLQAMAKSAKAYWVGQVPMKVGFLQLMCMVRRRAKPARPPALPRFFHYSRAFVRVGP
jgi:hypothetical protein